MATESSNPSSPALSWRPLVPDDAAACAVLLNAIEDVDHFGEFYDEESAAELIGDPVLDRPRGTLAAFDGDAMVGYSMAVHKPLAVQTHRVIVNGGVHPAHRRRGIGARLLAAGIAAAKELHALHHPDLPLAVDVQNNVRNAGAAAAYQAAGMVPIRYYTQMTHPLGVAIVDMPVPTEYVIENHSAENDDEFLAVRNEAFLDHWGMAPMPEQQWRTTLSGWQSFRPGLSFLLRDRATGTAAGMILTHSWDSDTEATGIRDAHFMLIGTRTAHRKRGVASALIAHAQREAVAAGYERTSLEVDSASPTGANSLYERMGFTVAGTQVRYSIEYSIEF